MYAELQQKIRVMWADKLSVRTGRSEKAIEEHGLKCTDFGGDSGKLTLDFEDGSSILFEGAFTLEDNTQKLLAVFTEHCGYHVFYRPSIEKVTFEPYG